MSDPSSGGPWPVHRRFPVTYHDLDVLRHLNHAAYFPMMETLRCDYYLGLIGTRDPGRLDIIVAEAACRYLAPVAYGSELVGEIAPARPLGRTSFVLLYRFRDATTSVPTAIGRTVIVCYDYASAGKQEISRYVRQRLEVDAVDPSSAGWEAGPWRSTRKGGVGVDRFREAWVVRSRAGSIAPPPSRTGRGSAPRPTRPGGGPRCRSPRRETKSALRKARRRAPGPR